MSTPLCLPFRKTTVLTPPLSTAIKSYISSKYDQHPDMFAHDLEAVDRMRTEAVNVKEPHASGLARLGGYAAVLAGMGGKFPVDIGTDFTWYPSLGYNTLRPLTQNNLHFERINILYNLAALYSQLAISTPRNSPDGLKLACAYFQACAGVVEYIKTDALPQLRSTAPEDMDEMTLDCVKYLMLAQAQECFWEKAVVDGRKDSLIARLAAQVSDFYAQAGDFGVKSDSISSDWIHHMTAKHHHFAAAAQYRAACDCLERSKYGEEIARLQDSLLAANEALLEARYVSKLVTSDLQGLKAKVTETIKRADKDNDMIYHEPVPSKAQLTTLVRACMVKADPPKEITEASKKLVEGGEYGPPLFQKLVPFAVHLAASIYAERKDRLVTTTVDDLESLTATLRSLLSSLNLPGSLQALERPLGLPQTLLTHASEIRQAGGVEGLRRAYSDVSKVKQNDAKIYNEAVELLRAEDEEDNKLRSRHGTDRWPRLPSKTAAGKLATQVEEYGDILRSADSSDTVIGQKIKDIEPALRLLAGDESVLEEYVPNSFGSNMTPKLELAVQKLRTLLNDVSRLESRRRRGTETLREQAKADDITQSILVETARLETSHPLRPVEPSDFEDLFAARLARYNNPSIPNLTNDTAEQETLIANLQSANSEFLKVKKVDTRGKEREQALQTLENAYVKYKDVIGNLDQGRKFYNNLATLVVRFREEVKGFCQGRRQEAESVELDIEGALQNLRLGENARLGPAIQPVQVGRRSMVGTGGEGGRGTPLPAPKAQRVVPVPSVPSGVEGGGGSGVWTPEQGIRFGPPTGGRY